MTETTSAIVQFKRMTRDEWSRSDYVPRISELVFETDTGFAKFGDGVHRFSDLRYLTGPQGPQGVQGIQGIQGPPGRDGVVTFESLSQEQRNAIKGDRGPRGADGERGERGHTLIANVRMEGTYRNNVTNNVKIFVEVYYDGQKVTNGFKLNIKHKGGNNTDWGDFFNRTYTENGEVLNYDWGNREQNGTPLEVIVVIEYQGMSTTASTRLENIKDGLPINENLLPDSDIGNSYNNPVWENQLVNSGLNVSAEHATKNFGRGLHIYGTANSSYKGLASRSFILVAKQGDKLTFSMDLGQDDLRDQVNLQVGLHYLNDTNQTVAQEWQYLDKAIQGLEVNKYKRISFTFTVGADMKKCRLMIYATPNQNVNSYIDNIKLERGEVATTWYPAYVDLQNPDIPVFRIAKGDINGTGEAGQVEVIDKNYIINSNGIKVGDVVQDVFFNEQGIAEGYWEITNINNSKLTVRGIGMRWLLRK